MKSLSVPFSARVRDVHKASAAGFPATARRGLLHTIAELIRRDRVGSWAEVCRELGRIARISPGELPSDGTSEQAEQLLMGLSWEKAVDFCERLYGYLSQGVYDYEFQRVTESREEVQRVIAEEVQRLFLEEGLPFDFRDGSVYRRGRRHSVDMVARAQVVLGDPRLEGARKHYRKALDFFENPRQPDYPNCVKEAVCAVEAAGKALFPEANASTLDDLLKWLTSDKRALLPKAVSRTVLGLYAFRGAGEGVAHGGVAGGIPTAGLAEFAMSVSASSIILLVDIAVDRDKDIPF